MKPKYLIRKITLPLILFVILASILLDSKELFSKQEIAESTVTHVSKKINYGLQPKTEQLGDAKTRNRNLERKNLAKKTSIPIDHFADDLELIDNETKLQPELSAADNSYQQMYLSPADEEKFTEAIDTLETNFWNEEENTQWTTEVETELVDALKHPMITDTQLDDVKCHTSLCLVEFVNTTLEDQDALLQQLGNMKPFFEGFMVKTEESGLYTRALVYFPKPGETLSLPLNLIPLEGEST